MLRKSILTLLLAVFFVFSLRATEGMWIPMLLKQLNEADMQAQGMKMSAEDIYSVNKSSLKDAIVSFGGFCTAEVISDQGLILTNHHCGYRQIQSHSSVENDYLTDGYWAMERSEELSNPGLTATFIIRMEDVTKDILNGVEDNMSEEERNKIIRKNITTVGKKATEGTHYEAVIKPFYYGNEYYMFITETFKDIRLVGAPPSSIGKFGGDEDNWMWPRHTGDFSLFRIYADKDNKPAEYSKDNVPYKPKKSLPISLDGVEKEDFTMVFGFPGRTQQYLTSYAVDMIKNKINPQRIGIREEALEIMDEKMQESDEVRIKYAAKYAGISNYYKKWQGENRGLKKLNAIQKKKDLEAKFMKVVENEPASNEEYKFLLDRFKEQYHGLEEVALARSYFIETVYRCLEIVRFAHYFDSEVTALLNDEKVSEERLEALKKRAKKHFKDYDAGVDKALMIKLLDMYAENVPDQYLSLVVKHIKDEHASDFDTYGNKVFDMSSFDEKEKVMAWLDNFNKKTAKKIKKDEAYILAKSLFDSYSNEISPVYDSINHNIDLLSRTYIKGLRELLPNRKYYPDANSTMRVAYGQAKGYKPRDAVKYEYYSTLAGIVEKHDPDKPFFEVPAKLQELYNTKDYGQYGSNGELRVCFTASNHTSGGNSGSPVINGEGELIGLNFDRNWEGTMSDIMYDPNQVRNISVDIRYVLFIVDKFAGAGHLVEEMNLVSKD